MELKTQRKKLRKKRKKEKKNNLAHSIRISRNFFDLIALQSNGTEKRRVKWKKKKKKTLMNERNVYFLRFFSNQTSFEMIEKEKKKEKEIK